MPSSWMARAKDRKGNFAVKAHIHRRLVCHVQAKHQRKKQKAGGCETILIRSFKDGESGLAGHLSFLVG